MNKEKMVKNIFSSIASKYDRANTFLTFGLDKIWRKKLVRLSPFSKDSHILDCATGTGHLAFEFLKKLGKEGRVVGIDFCEDMLKQIQTKDSRIQFQQANVLQLPFTDNSFDITSIAYGLRNLSDIEKGLKEMSRVTKPNGFLMVLETGEPSGFLRLYFKWIVPLIGGWITGQPSAYRYLNESSKSFPAQNQLVEIFNQTGCFKNVTCIPLFNKASFIYKAQVK